MKLPVIFIFFATYFSIPHAAKAEEIPVIEQGIYHPSPPFENIKTTFYVRERERPFLPMINDAGTSIAIFLIDVTGAVAPQAELAIRPVTVEARHGLRLPPIASFDKSHRYAGSNVYCWAADKDGSISFFIDWADITTNARYTDSYVFVKRGTSWFFEKHGIAAPRYWMQTKRYFQLSCPPA